MRHYYNRVEPRPGAQHQTAAGRTISGRNKNKYNMVELDELNDPICKI